MFYFLFAQAMILSWLICLVTVFALKHWEVELRMLIETTRGRRATIDRFAEARILLDSLVYLFKDDDTTAHLIESACLANLHLDIFRRDRKSFIESVIDAVSGKNSPKSKRRRMENLQLEMIQSIATFRVKLLESLPSIREVVKTSDESWERLAALFVSLIDVLGSAVARFTSTDFRDFNEVVLPQFQAFSKMEILLGLKVISITEGHLRRIAFENRDPQLFYFLTQILQKLMLLSARDSTCLAFSDRVENANDGFRSLRVLLTDVMLACAVILSEELVLSSNSPEGWKADYSRISDAINATLAKRRDHREDATMEVRIQVCKEQLQSTLLLLQLEM